MPNSSEARRIITEVFHPTLLHTSEGKASAHAGDVGLHTKKRRHWTVNAKCQLLSWLVYVSLTVVYFLLLLLLTRCIDVELTQGRMKTIVLLSWKSFKTALKDVPRKSFISPRTDHITERQDRRRFSQAGTNTRAH